VKCQSLEAGRKRGRTKNNYRAALATLLSFARQEGHLPRGIPTEAEFSSRYDGRGGEIGIYTAEKLKRRFSDIIVCGKQKDLRGHWPAKASATSEILRLLAPGF
jgi:hypothetical protein